MAYSSYEGYRTPAGRTSSLSRRSFSGQASSYPFSPYTPVLATSAHEDYSRYPASARAGAYDDSYIGGSYGDQSYKASGYSGHATPRMSSYYGSGSYDDMALDRTSGQYDERDYTYGAMTPSSRGRRPSTASLARQLSSGTYRSTMFDTSYAAGPTPTIKFRVKGALRSGITLTDAVAGTKLSGGDYVKWHQIKADARGRIFLRIRWNGYSALTYEIPVDGYDDRVRLSSLARRVARACMHFMQANSIPLTWDRVKLYYLEEVAHGTWQPALTVR